MLYNDDNNDGNLYSAWPAAQSADVNKHSITHIMYVHRDGNVISKLNI